MSDLIHVVELIAVAEDEQAETPPLPSAEECRAIREAADVPVAQIAAAVGVSAPTIYRVEVGTRMRSAAAERRLRRVLDAMRCRVLACDPHALHVAV